MGTFERELSDDLRVEASRVDPDVAAARHRLDERLARTDQRPGPQRSPFLAVAAAAVVVVGGALTYQLSDLSPAQVDATESSVLSDLPDDPDDGRVAPQPAPTTVPSTTAPAPDSTESGAAEPESETETDPNQSTLTWDQIPAPTIDRSVGNAVQIELRQFEFDDPDGVAWVDTTVATDDGRSGKVFGDEFREYSFISQRREVLASQRSGTPQEAVDALLRTEGVDPDLATQNTVETQTWILSLSMLTSGNLDADEWSDALRAVSTIDGVEFFDESTTDGRRVTVLARNRPGNEVWTLKIDGDTGQPILFTETNRNDEEKFVVEYSSQRIEVPPPSLQETGVAEQQLVSMAEAGVRLIGVDSGKQSTIALGGDHADVSAALEASLGSPTEVVASCPSGQDPSATLSFTTWPGLRTFADADGVFVGWFLTGNETVTTYTGLGVGSTVGDLQAVYPGLVLEPGPLGPSAFIDPIVYIASSSNSTSQLTHVLAGDVCTELVSPLEPSGNGEVDE